MTKFFLDVIERSTPQAKALAKEGDNQALYELYRSDCKKLEIEISENSPYLGVWSFLVGLSDKEFNNLAMWESANDTNRPEAQDTVQQVSQRVQEQ